jgi:hypothetical protein
MDNIKISIAKDFSKTPGPRHIIEGKFSGEKFRKEIMEALFQKAIDHGVKIEINLDGTAGYGTSFLEEVFGGLARIHNPEIVKEKFIIISIEEEYLIKDIEEYIRDANEEKRK